jgi:hypothetical protein
MSKLKKQAKNLLKAIEFEAAPLSTNKGTILRNDHCPNKVNSKKRRHRGWVTSRWAGKGDYKREMLEGNEPVYFYDDWQDARDGQRNLWDENKIYKLGFKRSGWRKEVYDNLKQLNAKLKKHEYIRRMMRAKERMKKSRKEKFIKR